MLFFLEFLRGFDFEQPCVTVFGSARFAEGHPHAPSTSPTSTWRSRRRTPAEALRLIRQGLRADPAAHP